MTERKTVARPFASHGILLKSDPSLVPPDRYLELTNFISPLEGNLRSRNGTQRLAVFSPSTVIHSLAYFTLASGKVRYVGATGQGTIFRSSSPLPTTGGNMAFSLVATGTSDGTRNLNNQRFTTADFAVTTGVLYKFLACQSRMLKDNGMLGSLQTWGMIPPVYPVTGLLNTTIGSGPAPFSGAQSPYTYVYTYYNAQTGSESSPCVYWVVNSGVIPNGHQLIMTLQGSTDPQVSSIRVYRAGGAFSDGFYRLLGQTVNPGGTTTIFYDALQDIEIASASLLQTDNDPPITSTLSASFYAFIVNNSANTNSGVIAVLTLGQIVSAPPAGVSALTPGSIIIIGTTGPVATPTSSSPEVCRVISVSPTTSEITIYIQNAHPVPSSGNLYVSCSAVTGAPASLVLSAFSCLFVAGDPNNPHVLYQSKNSLLESFPLIEQNTGIVKAIYVSNPSDPILALVEYGASVVCLCQQSIYTVPVFNSAMGSPVRTPAQRGLIGKLAWCRVSNEIWYVSYDGVYSFSGGQEDWESEEIDPLFSNSRNNQTVDGMGIYYPLDLRMGLGDIGADGIILNYGENEIFLYCNDIQGNNLRLRKHLKLNRWSVETITDPSSPGSAPRTTAAVTENDTGDRIRGKALGSGTATLELDGVGTSDGWVNRPDDGSPILCSAMVPVLSEPDKKDILFSDLMLEYSAGVSGTLTTFYNFATVGFPDPVDTFPLPPSPLRTKFVQGLHTAAGGKVGYSLTHRFVFHANQEVNLYQVASFSVGLVPAKTGISFDWDDLGYPNYKTLQRMNLEIDTGGVPALIQLLGDGVPMGAPFPITTTYATRKQEIWLDSPAYICKMVKPILMAGPNGATNYYTHSFDFLKQPAIVAYAGSMTIQSTGVSPSGVPLPPGFTDLNYTIVSAPQVPDPFPVPAPLHVGAQPSWYTGDLGSQWITPTYPFPPSGNNPGLWHIRTTFSVIGVDTTTAFIRFVIGANSGIVEMDLNGYQISSASVAQVSTATGTLVLVGPIGILNGSNTLDIMIFNGANWLGFRASVSGYSQGDIELEWSDLGYEGDKTLRVMHIEADTGGVQGTIRVQGDAQNLDSPFSITTTYQDRKRTITLPSNLTAKMVRPVLIAGVGGRFHYYSHSFEFFKEPSDVSFFDSLEFTCGYAGFKFIKQMWLQYQADHPLTITFYGDKDLAFYTGVLPAHPFPVRDVERFYLPDHGISTPIPIFGTGVTTPGVLTAAGGPDLHWMLVSVPNNPAAPPLSPVIGKDTNWYTGPEDSQWVSPAGPLVNQGPGQYTYATVFDMTGLDITTATVKAEIGASSTVLAVFLNGNLVSSGVFGNSAAPTLMTIRNGFLPSINVLQVQIFLSGSIPGPTGLRVAISGIANAMNLNKAKTYRFTISSAGTFKLYSDGSRIEVYLIGTDQKKGYIQVPLSELMEPHQ